MLEMALMLPILLVLAIGTIELSIGFYTKFFVQYAAASAATYLAGKNPPGLVKKYVTGLASGMGIPSSKLTLTTSRAPQDMSSCPDSALSFDSWCAKVTDSLELFIPFVNVNVITLQAAAQAANPASPGN